MIERLELQNFTVFKDLSIDLSYKVNVIIGANGTGKSHLLKAAYALCSASSALNSNYNVSEEDICQAITEKLLSVFLPSDQRLGRMRKIGTADCAHLDANFVNGKGIGIKFCSKSKSVTLERITDYERYKWNPVFIPTKEVMSLLKGFGANRKGKNVLRRMFDQTYFDLAARILDDSDKNPEPREEWLLEDIVNKMRGEFLLKNEEMLFRHGSYKEYANGKAKNGKLTYFSPTNKNMFSSQMMAEGFRKFGLLQRLLKNRSLIPGVSGTLFWDEPESNLNPKLMGVLVECLLALARSGQHIILASHDYFLLKWFDLRQKPGDSVMFHSLYCNPETNEIELNSTKDYLKIEPNTISETFTDLMVGEAMRSGGIRGNL